VLRAFLRIRDESALVPPDAVPEDLRHRPGTVAVEDEKTVALLREGPAGPDEGLGGRPLEERARLPVDATMDDVVGCRVPDVEAYRRVEPDELDELRLME
jgi:hypothetical protein